MHGIFQARTVILELCKALERDPGRRYQSAAEMGSAITGFAAAVAEPMFTSLGGGGFLLTRQSGRIAVTGGDPESAARVRRLVEGESWVDRIGGWITGCDAWVLHATPGWSETRLNDDPGQVAVALAKEFCISCGLDYAGIGYMVAHLWLYARVINPLDTGALWDPEAGLGLCGDWCLGDGIELPIRQAVE